MRNSNKKRFVRFLPLILFFISIQASEAQNFRLLKDINVSTDSYPLGDIFADYNNRAFTVFNGVTYFSADDGIHGRELWRSDGTTAGTYLLKDLIEGSPETILGNLKVAGNKLFFTISSGSFDALCVTDGTMEGTSIIPGPTGNLKHLSEVNGTIYFFDIFNNLWKSDGSPEGTKTVTKLLNGYLFTDDVVNFNGILYFSFYDYTNGLELFRSDGTEAGTFMVKDINVSGSGWPQQLTLVNNKLYFSADGGSGRILWESDGTAFGTKPAENSEGVQIILDWRKFTTLDNTIYFNGNSNSSGSELYKYDTQVPGISLVKDLAPGSENSDPQNLINVNGILFFSAKNTDGSINLWKSDGTPEDTKQVKNISTNRDYNFNNFYNFNGKLLFTYDNNIYGTEVWTSDGTEAGTQMVKDLVPGLNGSNPANFTLANNQVLFSAFDATKGFELWKTDGTSTGTFLLKDINQLTTSGSLVSGLSIFKDNLFFNAFDNEHGYELWKTDGTSAGTSLYADILPGASGSYPFLIKSQKENLYFFTNPDTLKLWKTSGAGDPPTFIKAFSEKGVFIDYGLGLHAAEKLVYFFLNNNNAQKLELWRSDGTSTGTFKIKSNFGISYQNSPVAIIGQNIFVADATDTSSALWKSDGTVEGTLLVKSFKLNAFNQPANLFSFNGNVYFNANDGNGSGLWKSDGTTAGTAVLKYISGFGESEVTESNGLLFFGAEDINGRQLWKTDGSEEGTKTVKKATSAPRFPGNLVDVNGILYFSADDGIHGRELWKSDGTDSGTYLVKDITLGPGSTKFGYGSNGFIAAHKKLFFIVSDAFYINSSLWESDGTVGGTNQVEDSNLKNVTRITNLVAINNQVVFSAYTYEYGAELFAGTAGNEENKPPFVSIKTPVNNATFIAGGNVYISAGASDPDGSVAKVEFYNGSELLSTKTDTPYNFKWQHVAKGSYTLTAKATDNSGQSFTSAPVYVSVVPNKAPTVNIVNPANNETFLQGGTIHLEAVAKDPDGRITKVEFYNGAVLLATEYKIPYTFDWKKVPVGNYIVTARAMDNWGEVTTSLSVKISVVSNKAPSVNVINPANGETFFAPATINLESAARDPDGRIIKVSFYSGTTLLATERKPPYTYQWQNLPAGTYNITAVAMDNWGAVTNSAPVTVSVTFPGPPMVSQRPLIKGLLPGREVVSLKLAPNPAKEIVNMYTTWLRDNKPAMLTIFSASGSIIQARQVNNPTQVIQLNVSAFVSGTYTIKLTSGSTTVYKQFVKL